MSPKPRTDLLEGAVTIDQLRQAAADRIKATHRRAKDSAAPAKVTITQATAHYDLVRVEYPDGEVREFRRARPADDPAQ